MRLLYLSFAAALLGVVPVGSAAAWSGTVLAQGGELSDFVCVNGLANCSLSTANPGIRYRSGWARGALVLNFNTNPTSDPPPGRIAVLPTAAWASGVATLWMHMQFCYQNGGSATPCSIGTTDGNQLLRIIDDLGNPTLIVRGTDNTGQVKVSSRTAGGSFTDLVTCTADSFPQTSIAQFDLEIISYGVAGTINGYANGNLICTFTGDIRNGDGATTLTGVEIGGLSTGISAHTTYVSEVIVATADTRDLNRKTAVLQSSGNTTAWTPSTGTTPCPSILGKTAYDDSTYVFAGTDGLKEQCTINASVPLGSYGDVLGLGLSGRFLVSSAAGPQGFTWGARVGGVDFDFGATQSPNAAFNNGFSLFQTTNPATGLPWAISDFGAAGFNVGFKSLP